MTPAAIRAAVRVPEYSVLCDACHGKMFVESVLCAKCSGEGRLLVTERRASAHISERGKFAVVLATAICLVLAAMIAILK